MAASGIYWRAVVLEELNLFFLPQIGMARIPANAFSLNFTPSLGVRPPQQLALQLWPQIGVASGKSASIAEFALRLTPRIGTIPSTAFKLSLTPHIGMRATPVLGGGHQINTAVTRASTY